MPTPHGTPIWYELVTPDPDGAKRFYDAVAGVSVGAPLPGPTEYRMIDGPLGPVGGVLKLDEAMASHGARPAWLLYVGVQDVDATVEQAKGLGAHLLMPPTDIPGIGRISLVADPQGAPFYVMRGASEEAATVFERQRPGRFGWNELHTRDVEAAMAFYGALFGWENRETMDMGPMGGYHFVDLGELRLGAAMRMPDQPPHWNLYFTVPDADDAAATVQANGGTVIMGPSDVPGGERIVIGFDPQGAAFALVSPPRA